MTMEHFRRMASVGMAVPWRPTCLPSSFDAALTSTDVPPEVYREIENMYNEAAREGKNNSRTARVGFRTLAEMTFGRRGSDWRGKRVKTPQELAQQLKKAAAGNRPVIAFLQERHVGAIVPEEEPRGTYRIISTDREEGELTLEEVFKRLWDGIIRGNKKRKRVNNLLIGPSDKARSERKY